MQSVIIGKNQAGQRLDKFLHKCLPLAGNGFLYKMLRKKNITLNGKKAEGGEILAPGDQVRFFLSDETFCRFSGNISREMPAEGSGGMPQRGSGERPGAGEVPGETEPKYVPDGKGRTGLDGKHPEIPGRIPDKTRSGKNVPDRAEYERAFRILQGITVLYEDEDCVIVDKPSGILSQKAAPGDVSLNEWLIGYLLLQDPSLEKDLPTFRPSVCNRIDRNTSGIVLCGRSLPGLQYLNAGIRERRIRKFYRTICVGAVREAGEIEGCLTKSGTRNRVSISRSSGQFGAAAPGGGKASPIRTAYRPIFATDDFTLLEVELITGKSHQVRAHLADIGHPVIGDAKYGQESVNRILRKEYGLSTQLLHACRVTFPESVSGPGRALGGRSILAPCPELFRRIEAGLFSSVSGTGKGNDTGKG